MLTTVKARVLKLGTNEYGIRLWKVASDQNLVRIVVIDVLFYFNLADILE